MSKSPSNEGGSVGHVLGQTRWDLLGELCRKPQNAAELAEAVKTSANAVRVHLDALEHAGLVSYEVVRRGGVGKPTHVYALTSAGESLLSRAYAPALAAILSAARSRMNGGFSPMLRAAGAALGHNPGSAGPRDGVADATRLLQSLGALVERERSESRSMLRLNCCPLAAVTRQTPEVCAMMEAAVEAASGMKTKHHCVPGTHPRCAFELSP